MDTQLTREVKMFTKHEKKSFISVIKEKQGQDPFVETVVY